MQEDPRRWPLLLAGACAGYALLMLTHPARSSLRDGWRGLRRYPTLWLVPAGFALAHAGFGLWVHCFEAWSVPGAPPALAPWAGWQPPPWPEAWAACWLPTVEGTSGLFNCIATTFPISAVAAAAFLVNAGGWQTVLFAALRRRFGWAGGLATHAGVLVCAVAAVGKPILFGGLPRLNAFVGEAVLLQTGEVLNWLGGLFEYLLSVGVQVYLVLLSFAWARGLTFDFPALRRFALRRFACVVKWAAVIGAVSSLGINLPLIAASLRPPGAANGLPASVLVTRWTLAVVLLIFCSVQATLIFHNRPLLGALADQGRLWRRHGGFLAWFIAVAALHFFALALANAFLPRALGKWTWPGVVWAVLLYPVLWSGLAGWLLASWACLFRRCERGHRPAGAREEF